MTLGLLAAALRALPMALVMPLPGLLPRVALGIALATAGMAGAGVGSVAPVRLPAEMSIGILMGLLVAAPIWAARYAGSLVGAALTPRASHEALGVLYGTLAWVVFFSVGGLHLLLGAYIDSYVRWPMAGASPSRDGLSDALVHGGTSFAQLSVQLALPALLALAILELGAALLTRFEESARIDVGASSIARGARPIFAMLLIVASLAAITRGVGLATRDASRSPTVDAKASAPSH